MSWPLQITLAGERSSKQPQRRGAKPRSIADLRTRLAPAWTEADPMSEPGGEIPRAAPAPVV
jgi:hypothetical protein